MAVCNAYGGAKYSAEDQGSDFPRSASFLENEAIAKILYA